MSLQTGSRREYTRGVFALALVLGSMTVGFIGCGVRGRPQPPLRPPVLGRGQPTFPRATESMAFPDVPSLKDEDDEAKKTDESKK